MRREIVVFISIITMSSSALAHGNMSIYKKLPSGWDVYYGTSIHICSAEKSYKGNMHLGIAFSDSSISLTLYNVAAKQNELFSIPVKTSTGQSGTLEGISFADGTVTFGNLSENTAWALADARSITISEVGTFNLSGSKEAMTLAYKCQKIMKEF